MTTDDQLEDKNQYSTATPTKKNSFDILDPSIIEKLEKMGNISPVFQGSNINNIINILFKNHQIDLVTYLDFKLKLSILEELITIEAKLDDIS
jgi:hypothetical protein